MKATQSEGDVSNRFGNRDFVLAVCTCFVRKCGRFEVIRDFYSLRSGVTIQFLVGGFVIHFAGTFQLSCSVQKFKLFKHFMLVQWLKLFFKFWGQI
jgi:hypothetical protein